MPGGRTTACSVYRQNRNRISRHQPDAFETRSLLSQVETLDKQVASTCRWGTLANSSSCTTTELSKLLTSCLTAVKNHVIRYCEKVYERSGKNLFWSIKNSGEVLNKLKSRGFRNQFVNL